MVLKHAHTKCRAAGQMLTDEATEGLCACLPMAGREAELQRGSAEYLGAASTYAVQVLCVCCCGSAVVCQSAPLRPSCAVSGNAELAAPAQAPWCLVLDMGDEVEGNEDCITATPLPATALRLAIANFGAGRWPNERYGRGERDEGRALAGANAELPTQRHSLEFPGCGSVNPRRYIDIYCSRLQNSQCEIISSGSNTFNMLKQACGSRCRNSCDQPISYQDMQHKSWGACTMQQELLC